MKNPKHLKLVGQKKVLDKHCEDTNNEKNLLSEVELEKINLQETDLYKINLFGIKNLPNATKLKYLKMLINSWK